MQLQKKKTKVEIKELLKNIHQLMSKETFYLGCELKNGNICMYVDSREALMSIEEPFKQYGIDVICGRRLRRL